MSPALARPLLHTAHLLTFTVLLGTGLLLFVPGLRGVLVGGYSLIIRQSHRWGGVAFVLLPAAILLRVDVRRVFAPVTQRSLRAAWQGLHVTLTLLTSLLLTVTGFVLWGKHLLPEALVDRSMQVHDWLTYAVVGFVGAHLLEVGVSGVVTRLQAAASEQTGT